MHFLLYLFMEKFTRLLFLLFTQLIPVFFNCSVEDGAVASAGISGQDEGILDESATVDSPEPLGRVEPGAFGDQCHRERDSKKGSITIRTCILGSLKPVTTNHSA